MDYAELLPPLPAKEIAFIGGPVRIVYGPYDADEMHAYALAAIAAAAPAIRKAERDRCEQECKNLADHYTYDEGSYIADHCALAIRDLKDV